MKVIAKKDVHIREGTPFKKTNNKKGVLHKGFKIKVVKTVSGEEIKNNDQWYMDGNGDYLWSGGFNPLPSVVATNVNASISIPTQVSDYRSLFLDIPEEWNEMENGEYKYRGQGIKLGIIDWGFDLSHPSISHLNKPDRKFDMTKSNSDGNDDLNSNNTHGSECISLIASNLSKGIIGGIAPDTDVFFLQTKENDSASFKRAVEKAAELDLHILFSAVTARKPANTFDDQVMQWMERKNGKKSCLFVGASNKSVQLATLDNPLFPFDLSNCLSVGGIWIEPSSTFWDFKKLNYLFYTQTDIQLIQGNTVRNKAFTSSYASALFAGLICIYLSSKRNVNQKEMEISPKDVRNLLFEKWVSFQDNTLTFAKLFPGQIKPSIAKLKPLET
ncbi:MAG: S8 family serine peptidase [Bacteroidota bacterium]